METLKLTPIDQIEDMADGVPVLAVEGVVKYAQELKQGQSAAGHAWNKQFFVLSSGTAEIACSMWDAEGSELSKDEKVHIENTQNKKGVWSGMVKGSYMKTDPEGVTVRKHTLEIRCNQVKITQIEFLGEPGYKGLKGEPIPTKNDEMTSQRDHKHGEVEGPTFDPDWPEVERKHPIDDPGINEARKHLMQSANLYNLCVACVEKVISPSIPEIGQTSEMFQAAVGTLFIEASRAGFVSKMPQYPI